MAHVFLHRSIGRVHRIRSPLDLANFVLLNETRKRNPDNGFVETHSGAATAQFLYGQATAVGRYQEIEHQVGSGWRGKFHISVDIISLLLLKHFIWRDTAICNETSYEWEVRPMVSALDEATPVANHVRVEVDGPITTIVMNRPERRNAVDGPMALALRDAFLAFEADESQRVAVLWGDNGVFCAGADLTSLNDPARTHILDLEGGGTGPMGPTRLALSKPLIAAVAGYAVAGGLELALLADMRVAEQGATFGVFCRRWGVPLIDGGTVRLPRAIGMSRALDMILTGRAVGAQEALEMGLASRVVPDGQSRQHAEELARQIAAFPQQCMLADRRSAYAQWDLELDAALRLEGRLGAPIVAAEGKAGATRFVGGMGRHGKFDR